jgi:phosphonate utilization associated putative membrane protein
MTLTWPVVAAVLFAALLHASWNALVKSSSDKPLDTATIHLIGSVLGLPLAMLAGWPRAEAWPYIAASTAIHLAYFTALSRAYQHGDLGLTYPLMRGSAPLLVALASALALGEPLSPLAWAGVLAVSAGVLALGLSRHALQARRGVGFALANAVVIACYTLVDGLGARAAGNALQYVLALYCCTGWPFGLLVVARRGLGVALPYARRRAPVAALAVVCSAASYGIALWAMTQAPMATVAALRETSVLFAAVLGTVLLKESFNLRRALATAAILGGVMALRLA